MDACVRNFLSIIHVWKMYLSHIPTDDNIIFLYPTAAPTAKFHFYFLLAQHNILLFKTLSKKKI